MSDGVMRRMAEELATLRQRVSDLERGESKKIGLTVTVGLAKLTTGGTNGSLIVVNGVVTGYIPPT